MIGLEPCNLIRMAASAIATKTAIIGINQDPTSKLFAGLPISFGATFVWLIITYLIAF